MNRLRVNRTELLTSNNAFGYQPSSRDIEKARTTLGLVASKLTDEELKDISVEIRFLVESWLDKFETEVFDGKTLREFLLERNRP